jgi:parallel beta-helix repeat protein
VDIASGVSATLQGIRITGSDSLGSGGGIRSAGKLALTNCAVSGNLADRGGGIAHASAATGPLDLTNCRISGNTALVGSGAGLILENSTQPVTIAGCTISGNTSSLAGGGIQKDGGSCSLTGTEISGNKAGANGGGVFNMGTMTFDAASRITNNTSDAQGGGIFNEVGSTVTLNGATVTGNSPQNCAGTAVPGCAG